MLKKFIFKNPFQLFLTILLPFLVSTVLLLFVQFSLLNNNFENYALHLVYNQHKTDLEHTSRNVSVMEESVKTVSITAFFDSMVKDLLYSDVDSEDFVKYKSKLQSYKNIYPFLQSIYIYNGQHMYTLPSEGFVYDRNSFYDPSIFPILDDIHNHKTHSIVLRRIPNILSGITSNAADSINVYSYLFFDSQEQSGKVNEAIILNVSEDWVKNSISSSDPNNRIFIINREGVLLSDDEKHPLLSELKQENYIQKIQSSSERMGNFRMEIDGVDSFVTFAATDVFDWKLISITPYSYIIHDLENMKQKTLLLVVSFIIGSILLSFYLSRRLYVPISSVIQNYLLMESEKKNDFYMRKQEFLRSLVVSNELPSTEFLYKQFKKFHVELEPSDCFIIVLLRIDHFSDFSSKYKRTDRNLLMFGMVNIVSEIIAQSHPHECIEMEEDRLVIFMSRRDAALPPSEDQRLVALVQEFQQKLQSFLNISVSIACSEAFHTLAGLNYAYLKTVDLSCYRLILGHRSITYCDNFSMSLDNYKYPQDQDKELTDAIIRGQFDQAKLIFSNMVENASTQSYSVINSVMIRLLLSIRYAIEILETNLSLKIDFNFNKYLENIQKIETLKEMQSDFFHLFDNLALELESKKDNKYLNILDDVIMTINQEFTNPALSLNTIADRVNLSPRYLGNIFKKHRFIPVADYIDNIRLKYASELISNSDETINVIMDKSGFLSRSHFYNLFKQAYGVTPNQYRSNARKKSVFENNYT